MIKLTVDEIARNLSISSETIERWIRQGRIPIRKKGAAYIFNESDLVKWAALHNLSYNGPENNTAEKDRNTAIAPFLPDTLFSAIKTGGVFHNVPGTNVESVLKSASGHIPVEDQFKAEIYKRILERETLMSTGLGKGIAFPHPRTPFPEAVDHPMITMCFTETPVDFNAIDNELVFVLFVLISPSTKIHLNMLSRLAFCIRDESFYTFIKACPDMEAILEKIAELEKNMDRTLAS